MRFCIFPNMHNWKFDGPVMSVRGSVRPHVAQLSSRSVSNLEDGPFRTRELVILILFQNMPFSPSYKYHWIYLSSFHGFDSCSRLPFFCLPSPFLLVRSQKRTIHTSFLVPADIHIFLAWKFDVRRHHTVLLKEPNVPRISSRSRSEMKTCKQQTLNVTYYQLQSSFAYFFSIHYSLGEAHIWGQDDGVKKKDFLPKIFGV